jgi:pimeloyl-ACP methyl ester carboxylesterase
MDAKGLRQATVVGHSMGSFIAQQVALAAPERVSRLVLVGSAPSARNDVIRDLLRAVETLPDPVPAAFVRDFQVSTVFRPLPDGFMDRAVAESLKLPAHVWRSSVEGMLVTEPAAALSRSRIPTLLISGDRDAVFSVAEQDELRRMLPAAEFTRYEETGHAPHWERSEEFTRDLVEFMERAQGR